MATLSFRKLTIHEANELSIALQGEGQWKRLLDRGGCEQTRYTLVAYKAEQPVGFILCDYDIESDTREEAMVRRIWWEPTYVYVDPTFRNGGIASRMIRDAGCWSVAQIKRQAELAVEENLSPILQIRLDIVSKEGGATSPTLLKALVDGLSNQGISLETINKPAKQFRLKFS